MSTGARLFMAQAEDCRRHAADLDGKPEAPFLLRIAAHFEELATQSTDRLAQESASAGRTGVS